MKATISLLFLLLAAATPASAQWIQQKKEDPFDGKHLYIAVTAAAGYGFGLRCEAGSDKPEMLLMTPEKVDASLTQLINLGSPKLIVIVDDLPPKTLDATLSRNDDEQLIVLSDDPIVLELAGDIIVPDGEWPSR